MSGRVTILNRQRKIKADTRWLQTVTDRLFEQVLQNLEKNRPQHLRANLIREMAARGQISLTLVSNTVIRQLNKRWRGKNLATDVLSFPLTIEAPPAPMPFELGEVVISLEKAKDQAADLGHSFEREVAFLFVHGVLHVLGFDHQTPAEEKDMIARQHAVLSALGLAR